MIDSIQLLHRVASQSLRRVAEQSETEQGKTEDDAADEQKERGAAPDATPLRAPEW